MARKNIFEILAEKVDIQQQLEKIEELLSENSIDNDSLRRDNRYILDSRLEI